MRILLVEKDLSTLKLLKKYVSSFYRDSEIVDFSDSRKAMEYLETEHFAPDICYTAVMMPGITGFQLAEALKKQCEQTKIVFLSVSAEYAIDAWEYQVKDYLLKPITYEKVKHAVASCMPKSFAI